MSEDMGRIASLNQEVGRLKAELAKFKAAYLGEGQRPAPGYLFSTVPLGDTNVLVEFEALPAEEPNYDADSPGVGPGCSAGVSVVNALINGKWLAVQDYFLESVVKDWEDRILEEMTE